jgi:UDP-N-acetylglucosamine 2-epimerase (non-hydrolysing)
MPRILVVLGTRPEAIKLAPVIHALREHARDEDQVIVCSSGQHREMLSQTLGAFGISPDMDLEVMEPGQCPSDVVGKLMIELGKVYQQTNPDWVVVQGDTATVAAGALSAFMHRIKVAHVEAGLRTHDKSKPFPEEINRRVAGVVADMHFAATEQARDHLLREGNTPDSIMVTGNTVVDALRWMSDKMKQSTDPGVNGHADNTRLVLVTAHRRESHGEPIREVCRALKQIAEQHQDIRIVYPVHMNPNICGPVREILDGVDRITLCDPLEYPEFMRLMSNAYMIITDSGGIQEEASVIGVPTLLLRESTERPEAVQAGVVLPVGTDRDLIVKSAAALLTDPAAHAKMAKPVSVFGDGLASQRIAHELLGLGDFYGVSNRELEATSTLDQVGLGN